MSYFNSGYSNAFHWFMKVQNIVHIGNVSKIKQILICIHYTNYNNAMHMGFHYNFVKYIQYIVFSFGIAYNRNKTTPWWLRIMCIFKRRGSSTTASHRARQWTSTVKQKRGLGRVVLCCIPAVSLTFDLVVVSSPSCIPKWGFPAVCS